MMRVRTPSVITSRRVDFPDDGLLPGAEPDRLSDLLAQEIGNSLGRGPGGDASRLEQDKL